MESVLTASLILFIILFTSLTLYQVFMTSQETLVESWQNMETRLDAQSNSVLSPLSTRIRDSVVEVVLKNDGLVKFAAFDQWDVIVQYYDAGGGYHIQRLAYTQGTPITNEWTDAVICQNGHSVEMFDAGVLNPGEVIMLQLVVMPEVGAGKSLFIRLATDNGSSLTHILTRNIPPVLVTNNGLKLAAGQTQTLTRDMLEVTDADNTPEELVYTASAAQGTLPETFTQADIHNGLVQYTHTGTEHDVILFRVSDGQDEIGEYTFEIRLNQPPVLAVQQSLVLSEGSIINQNLLEVTDPDTAPSELVYTVTTPPTQGTLNLGSAFTQEDINLNRLQYTGTGSDSFQFTVSDGMSTLGIAIFTIVP